MGFTWRLEVYPGDLRNNYEIYYFVFSSVSIKGSSSCHDAHDGSCVGFDRCIETCSARSLPEESCVPAGTADRVPHEARPFHIQGVVQTMSQSLIPLEYVSQVLEQSESSPPTAPWSESYTMQLFSLGGARSLDTERVAIVGTDGYNNYVAGNREIATHSQDAVCGRVRTIRIHRFEPQDETQDGPAESEASGELEAPEDEAEAESPADSTPPVKPGPPAISGDSLVLPEPDDPHSGVRWGHDRLSVQGNAEIRFASRSLLAKGTFERTWNGGVVRLASFEGVIAGGFFTRAIAGPSAALSGVMSSDVYGGAIKLSITRSFLAGLHYRAAKLAQWRMLYYRCAATFNIRPAFTVAKAPARKGIGGKIARLASAASKAFKVVRWFVAPISIAYGALKLLMLPFSFIGNLLRNRFNKPPPPVLQPRMHVHVGLKFRQSNVVVCT